MTTKEQERKALEQIKKIVSALGENSYVATALEGCFEIAEENIDYDMACSMKQRAEAHEKNEEYFHGIANEQLKEISDLEEKVEDLRKELALAKETIKQEAERANTWVARAQKEHRAVTIGTTDGYQNTRAFCRIQYYDDNGFKFVNIVEPSGWTNSFKCDEISKLIIE